MHPASAPPPDFDVAVRHASLRYGGAFLFRDLDFVLPGGRCTCLLGPSGVGKSSLLRVIAGLAPLDGARCSAPTGGRWPGASPGWASATTCCRGCRCSTTSRSAPGCAASPPERAQALALLARVGLARQQDQLPATLSGGQRQRAALARTLMEDRPVVLMDEPFSALDAITRARLQVLAAGLLAGRTVLLVTHDPLEALRLGHRIQVMAGQPARIEARSSPPARRRAISTTPPCSPGRASCWRAWPMRATPPLEQPPAAPRPARPAAALAGPGVADGRAAFLLPPPTAVARTLASAGAAAVRPRRGDARSRSCSASRAAC